MGVQIPLGPQNNIKMKIELEEPFANVYKAGYVNINTEPRRVVLLVYPDNTQTSVSYARYLMSVHLNRFLEPTEHVDHKDDDKLNDVISNLQILTPKENNIKKVKHLGIETKDIKIICPVCGARVFKKRKNVQHKIVQGIKPTCSRKCGGIYGHKNIN